MNKKTAYIVLKDDYDRGVYVTHNC